MFPCLRADSVENNRLEFGHLLDGVARAFLANPTALESAVGHKIRAPQGCPIDLNRATFNFAGKTQGVLDVARKNSRAETVLAVVGHGNRFIDRVFTATERAKAEKRRNRVETYAKRFAAKEACAKALGTGLRAGVWWRDMGVVNLPSGRPTLALTGGAKRRLAAMTPAGYEARIDLTITDEGPMAQAFVIISAVAIGDS